MKMAVFAAFVAATASLATPASAQRAGDIYIQGNVGSSWGTDELGQSGLWGLAAGRHMTRNLRLELAADWRDGYRFIAGTEAIGSGNGDVDSAAYFANIYWDFYDRRGRARGLTPYLGLGFGLAQHETKDIDLTATDGSARTFRGDDVDRFGWQLMGGFTVDTGESSLARIGYRYLDHGMARLDLSPGFQTRRVRAHEVTASLGFRF